MGVDVNSVMAFGTDDEEDGNIILGLLEQKDKNDDALRYYIAGDIDKSHIKDLTKEQQEIVKDFMGFELWTNSYNDDFEGFGIEENPGTLSEGTKTELINLFKKYNLSEPGWVSFSHWW